MSEGTKARRARCVGIVDVWAVGFVGEGFDVDEAKDTERHVSRCGRGGSEGYSHHLKRLQKGAPADVDVLRCHVCGLE